ncbi:hypothetical protein HMPREF1255_1331 [Propionimicrobium sp. BV2F7]|nr:hypothetical protein HMPREF1255_1331 [Propionimicrobium sp. BV2F7]
MKAKQPILNLGSSPLARGAQDAIAAYFRRAADHPRSRGEHSVSGVI